MRVLRPGNFHVSAHKDREARKQKSGELTAQESQEAADYDTDAILSQSGVPGMGMRIALSSADLQQLRKEAGKSE